MHYFRALFNYIAIMLAFCSSYYIANQHILHAYACVLAYACVSYVQRLSIPIIGIFKLFMKSA